MAGVDLIVFNFLIIFGVIILAAKLLISENLNKVFNSAFAESAKKLLFNKMLEVY